MNLRRRKADLNDAIAKVLRYGVATSALVLATGLALMLAAPPSGTPGTLQAMLETGFGTPTLSPSQWLKGVSDGSPIAVLELGTLLLLLTPLARVGASVLLFLKQRDAQYTCVTLVVLSLLLLAIFVIGPVEG